MNSDIIEKIRHIKLMLLDLHGVILSGTADCDADLDLLSKDAHRAGELGIRLGVITQCNNEALLSQISAAGVSEIVPDAMEKLSGAEKLAEKYQLDFSEIGYIGDDILDIPLLSRAGFSAAPKNARREVKRIVNYVCHSDCLTPLGEVLGLLVTEK